MKLCVYHVNFIFQFKPIIVYICIPYYIPNHIHLAGTTVAMVTIVLTYLATSTTFLILFWFFFCFPAIKHNQLHKRLTQEQVWGYRHTIKYTNNQIHNQIHNPMHNHLHTNEVWYMELLPIFLSWNSYKLRFKQLMKPWTQCVILCSLTWFLNTLQSLTLIWNTENYTWLYLLRNDGNSTLYSILIVI